MNDETKISKCPYCEACFKWALQSGKDYHIHCVECNYHSGVYGSESEAISAHNAHCALIEKGRQWDELERELKSLKYSYNTTIDHLMISKAHLDTAVKLLDMIMSGSDSLLSGRAKVITFLAEPAIKKITDTQKGK